MFDLISEGLAKHLVVSVGSKFRHMWTCGPLAAQRAGVRLQWCCWGTTRTERAANRFLGRPQCGVLENAAPAQQPAQRSHRCKHVRHKQPAPVSQPVPWVWPGEWRRLPSARCPGARRWPAGPVELSRWGSGQHCQAPLTTQWPSARCAGVTRRFNQH